MENVAEAAEKIRILVTGGTFDKEYNELTGELYFMETHLPELLRQARAQLDVEVSTLMLIDSLRMTDADRRRIAEACRAAPAKRIVITHGTDTMTETARYLTREVTGKTVVLTGAMIPIKFGSSDGLFNLGAALMAVQTLPTGIHVAMNGRFFAGDRCRKNRSTGVFEPL